LHFTKNKEEPDELVSNLDVYLAIAEEALAESERLDKSARTPKPDGEPGFIVRYDPKRKSFKNSLIAITFAGIYLEALFYIVGVNRFGATEYNKNHDRKTYEQKLRLFGISDAELLTRCECFREMRKDVVHEKAIAVNAMTGDTIHMAQQDAKEAVSFVKHVAEIFARKDGV